MECKSLRNTEVLKHTLVGIGIGVGSMMFTAVVYFMIGIIMGTILHPSTHKECACDDGAILTELEAILLGVIYMIFLMWGLSLWLRRLEFSKWEQVIALIFFLIINLYMCNIVNVFFTTQTTG
ncbi:MAG: hypothetical protein J6B03_01780 [Candidatus Homeothermus sp.]|nr:hypothetical protein [Candidatus Homeothermus sp.]